MKKLNQLFAALLLVAAMLTTATAQISIGAKVGMNANTVYTTDGLGAVAPNFKNLVEINYGLVADIPVAGGFSVQPEINYITKGFGLKQGLDVPLFGIDLPLNATAETRFRYVEMPLLAKYAFGQEGVQAYFMAGPTLGYATAGRIDTRANILTDIRLPSVPVNLDAINYERFEVGAAIGAGIQANMGPVRAFLDARYQRGFTELYDIPLVNERVRNQGWSISTGVMVPIGG